MSRQSSKLTEADSQTQPLRGEPILTPDTVLAQRFRIVELLGYGGQAQVYRAFDQVLREDVALKLVQADHQLAQSEIDSLRQEVLLARQLSHPNIVRIHEFYQTQDYVFFTMAMIEGRSLSQVVAENIKPAQLDKWFLQLMSALEACHESDIVHGDIKPSNIMIAADGSLVLVDFGIGKHLALGVQSSGTRSFLAPEVTANGQFSTATDRYAAGKILNRLLSAVEIKRTELTTLLWYRKRQYLAASLQHPTPEKRTSIAQSKLSIEQHSNTVFVAGVSALIIAAIISVVFIWNDSSLSSLGTSDSQQENQVIAISVAADDRDLRNVGQLTQVLLQAHPDIYPLELSQVDKIKQNLVVRPHQSAADRKRLATLLNSDLVMILERHAISDNDVLTLLLYRAASERVVATKQFDLAKSNWSELPEQIISVLMQRLSQAERPIQYDESVALLYQDIKAAVEQGDNALAKRILDQLKQLQANSFWGVRAEALLASKQSEFEKAAELLDRLLTDYPTRPDLLADRAKISFALGSLTAAKTFYQRALKGDQSQPQWWFELAKIKIIQGDIRSALDNELLTALIKFRQREDIEGLGLVLNAFGVAHLRLAEFDKASDYFLQSLNYRTPTDFPTERVTTLSNLATAYAIEGDYKAADSKLQEAKQLAEALNDRVGIAHIENERGLLLEEQGFYQQALTHYKAALDIRLQTDDAYLQSQSINHVAFIHFLLGDFSLAEVYWRQAIDVLSEMNEVAVMQSTQINFVQLLLVRGQYQQAEQHLTQLLSATETSSEVEFATYLQLSKLNFVQGEAAIAVDNVLQATALAKRSNDLRGLVEGLLWHAEIRANLHQDKKLQTVLNQLNENETELNNEQKMRYRWLKIRLLKLNNKKAGQVAAVDFAESILSSSLSKITEAKILSDLASRFEFSEQHSIWPRLKDIVTPAMYEEHLAFLFALDSAPTQQRLWDLTKRYPNYWRNYEYLVGLSKKGASQTAKQALQNLLNGMNEEQRKAYEKFVNSH